MATVSQSSFTQYLHFRGAFCHCWLHNLSHCISWECKYQRWKHCPSQIKYSSFPHIRNMQWAQERLWKCHLTWLGSALVSRWDPRPLLKPSIVCAIDVYRQGCSTSVVSAQTADWARKPGFAPALSLSESADHLCAAVWEWTGAAFMEMITWITEENGNGLFQLPSCNQAAHGLNACECQGLPPLTSPHHRELMGCQLQLEGSSLLFIKSCRAHWVGANHQPFLGKLLLGWGVMHHRQELDSLTLTRVIFFPHKIGSVTTRIHQTFVLDALVR